MGPPYLGPLQDSLILGAGFGHLEPGFGHLKPRVGAWFRALGAWFRALGAGFGFRALGAGFGHLESLGYILPIASRGMRDVASTIQIFRKASSKTLSFITTSSRHHVMGLRLYYLRSILE